MQSICPTCLSEIEHEEGKTQVECTGCGAVFDPSQQTDDLPPIESSMLMANAKKSKPAEAEPAAPAPPVESVESAAPPPEPVESAAPAEPALEEDPLGDFGALDMTETPAESLEPVESPAEIPSDFTKSEEVFEEIREFGESVLPGQEEPKEAPPAESKNDVSAPPVEATPAQPAASGAAVRMTSGSALQGFVIEEYFTPVSLNCKVDVEAEEPLKPAYDKLSSRAQTAGGNAIVDLKWKLSPDGNKVIISGTPVRCKKAG